MSQTGPEEQPGEKTKQHDDDSEGHLFGAERQPGVFNAQDDEDDTEGHRQM